MTFEQVGPVTASRLNFNDIPGRMADQSFSRDCAGLPQPFFLPERKLAWDDHLSEGKERRVLDAWALRVKMRAGKRMNSIRFAALFPDRSFSHSSAHFLSLRCEDVNREWLPMVARN